MFGNRLLWRLYSTLLIVVIGAGVLIGILAAPTPGPGVSLSAFWIQVAIGTIITAIAGLILSRLLSHRFARSLATMRRGAGQFAVGDFDHRINVDSIEELGNLGYSLNVMAMRLEEQRREILQERNELETTLSGMADGILAIDREGRLVNLNPAAAALFDLDMKRSRGKTIVEIVRNTALQEFAKATLDASQPIDTELVITRDGERHIHVLGSPVRDTNGQTAASVMVLHDITALRKLETMRRDFVANVSHELKTPITSIKGYVETILDTPDISPEDSRKFLETVRRQSERLNAIIDDLLSLSRIEQGVERAEIAFSDTNVDTILSAALHSCEPAAKAKHVTLTLQNHQDIHLRANGALLEQAVVNLVDNAVKYSPEGAQVEVAASADLAEIEIQVKDNGPGISKEHQSRIFERFYRVDKSRSRDAGGTGLGLAIVKHIVVAHHGSISLESELGRGSTFRIRLPR